MQQPEEPDVRILVVDDDEAVRIVTSEMLKRMSFDVESVSSGEEALSLLDRDHFAAVLLDVGMPVMSGVEVYAHIRNNLPEQKVVFMTGYSAEEITDLDNSNTWMLSKPFSMQNLSEIVGAVLPR